MTATNRVNPAPVVLPDSKSVRQRVKAVFSKPGRRVAVVAFVGEDAADYLGPHVQGTEIYCWPRAGGTNPRAIRDLINKHRCKVHFVDRLHMKIFWSAHGGCVIGSANLTNNALGENGLHEAGAFFPNSSSINIDALIKALPTTKVNGDSLSKLDREHKAYFAKNGAGKHVTKARPFSDWFRATPREQWKLGWWDAPIEKTPKEIVTVSREDFGGQAEEDFLLGKKGSFSQEDWVLSYRIDEHSPKIYRSEIAWLYVERLILTDNADGFPWAATQFKKTSHFGKPPFILDRKFREAFAAASLSREEMMPELNCIPSSKLLNRIAEAYLKS